jgi:NAD(P)-dependent dehydrogenase (short-subunit alcohol dehydrogenase family)
MSEFAGSVAIVAGGALGIGRAAAQRLAQGDASVVICSDQSNQVEQAADGLRSEGLEVQGLRADVTSQQKWNGWWHLRLTRTGAWTSW